MLQLLRRLRVEQCAKNCFYTRLLPGVVRAVVRQKLFVKPTLLVYHHTVLEIDFQQATAKGYYSASACLSVLLTFCLIELHNAVIRLALSYLT